MKKLLCIGIMFCATELTAMEPEAPRFTLVGRHASTAAVLGFVQQFGIMYLFTKNNYWSDLQGLIAVYIANVQAIRILKGSPRHAFALASLLGGAAGIILARNSNLFDFFESLETLIKVH